MSVLIINKNNFDSVKSSSKPILLDFYADWCGPCKMMAPIVAELAKSFEGKCKIGKCNTDENPRLVNEFRIMSIPTFIVFKEGQAAETFMGAIPKKELEEKIRQVLA